MSLRADHFRSERLAFSELLRWTSRHGIRGFGLVPSRRGEPDSLQLELTVQVGTLHVVVTRCLAVAPDGTLIHVDSTIPLEAGGTPALSGTCPLLAADTRVRPLTVAIEAAAGREFEHGPLADDEPPRARWALPEHRLLLLDEVPLGSGQLLEVARLQVEGEIARLDERFIPPALAVGALRRLREEADAIAGTFQRCRDGAVIATQQLAEQRSRGLDASGMGMPAERVSRELAMIASRAFSRIVDEGDDLPPWRLIAGAREFLREFRTLVDTQVEVRDGPWGKHLRRTGRRGLADHVEFSRELDTKLRGAVEPHPLAEPLATAKALVELVAGLPPTLTRDEGGGRPDGEPAGAGYRYQDRTYAAVEFSQIEYEQFMGFHSLSLHGLTPLLGGRFLVWIKAPPERKRLMETLKGNVNHKPYIYMSAVPVDSDHDPDAVILLVDGATGQPAQTLYLGCPVRDANLAELSNVPGVDIRLYHRS